MIQIEVTGAEGHLTKAAESALTLKPNFQYTEQDIKGGMSRVLELGWVKSCKLDALPTTDGFKLILDVSRPFKLHAKQHHLHILSCEWCS